MNYISSTIHRYSGRTGFDMKTKLNMGSGFNKLDTHWNVDSVKMFNPDEVVDLESIPFPWADDTFEEIFAKDILEHLGENSKHFIKIISEMYRVTKPGGTWKVIVPHWNCDLAYDDPTHVRVITASMFKLFDQEKNVEAYKTRRSDTPLGLIHNIDLQITDVKFDMIEYWHEQINNGMITNRQLDINLNTLNNVAQSTEITLVVHKPCRYTDWARKFIGES